MNIKELLKQRVDDEDLLPELPQENKDKNTEIVKAYKEGYEQGKKDAERRGRWIHKSELYTYCGRPFYPKICSVCNGVFEYETTYCPDCGARMEAE